jgi:hypothetical protein
MMMKKRKTTWLSLNSPNIKAIRRIVGLLAPRKKLLVLLLLINRRSMLLSQPKNHNKKVKKRVQQPQQLTRMQRIMIHLRRYGIDVYTYH